MPLAVDLFCGKGGWTIGLQAAGWDVIGFDIASDLTRDYPGHLCIQDVATVSGYPMRGRVGLIVASPPCQRYSYMAMPWSRAKAQAAEIRVDESAEKLRELNRLFNECFRIAREAGCPLVVENVRGAQPWVGRSAWNYGSFYLWGDIPALMPRPRPLMARKVGGDWFGSYAEMKAAGTISPTRLHSSKATKTVGHANKRNGFSHTRHLTNQRESDAIKQHGSGAAWFDHGICSLSSSSLSRREASAQIAMIPFDLAKWIGEVYYPRNTSDSRQNLAKTLTVDSAHETAILYDSTTCEDV